MALTVSKTFRFEAAHVLPGYVGNCSRIHGHSYKFTVTLGGELQEVGSNSQMIMDFSELKRIVQDRIISQLDHMFLSANRLELPVHLFETFRIWGDFARSVVVLPIARTTAEELVRWIFTTLSKDLSNTPTYLVSVTLWETEDSSATYTG